MDPNVTTTIIGAVAGLLGGAIASLAAPWIHWGIEKRRDRRATQRALIATTRTFVASREFAASSFAKHAEYARLRPHFKADVVRAVENPDDVQDQMDDPGEFREGLRREILDELTRIERRWKLI